MAAIAASQRNDWRARESQPTMAAHQNVARTLRCSPTRMPAPLLVSETLLAEGAAFLAAVDNSLASGGAARVRLAQRLPVLHLLLEFARLSLQRALRPPAGVSAAQLRRELATTERALRAYANPAATWPTPSGRSAAPSLRTSLRLLAAEFRTIAALARAADDDALFLWARRRARMYRSTRCANGQAGALRADGITMRTRSRGTSSTTKEASASTAATRGKVVRSTRDTRR
jgi:hypothetical protein